MISIFIYTRKKLESYKMINYLLKEKFQNSLEI